MPRALGRRWSQVQRRSPVRDQKSSASLRGSPLVRSRQNAGRRRIDSFVEQGQERTRERIAHSGRNRGRYGDLVKDGVVIGTPRRSCEMALKDFEARTPVGLAHATTSVIAEQQRRREVNSYDGGFGPRWRRGGRNGRRRRTTSRCAVGTGGGSLPIAPTVPLVRAAKRRR